MDAGLVLVRLVIGPSDGGARGAETVRLVWRLWTRRGTGGFFEGLGFRPGRLFAAAAAVTEIASGLLVALGLLGPVGPALMLSVMIVAALSVHWPNAVRPDRTASRCRCSTASTRGRAGADRLRRLFARRGARPRRRSGPRRLSWAALAIGVVGGLANLGLRRPAAQAPAHA